MRKTIIAAIAIVGLSQSALAETASRGNGGVMDRMNAEKENKRKPLQNANIEKAEKKNEPKALQNAEIEKNVQAKREQDFLQDIRSR